METLANLTAQFHLLRPWWLLLVIPSVALFFTLKHYRSTSNSWAKIIAPELLPFMLDNAETKRHSMAAWWLIFWVVGTIAAAGPTWQKIPLPVHKSQQPLVILFDLSPSMLVEDIKPNRLTRAKLKLIDLLNQRKEGTTALISYAGEAFVVSPLTDDTNTIANMVPALHPNIMPRQGSQAEQALDQALQLIKNTGESQGDILFITDGIAFKASDKINSLLRTNTDIRLSILGVGSSNGGPIPLGRGGFAKDSNGSIVIPRLKASTLTQLASRHGGICVAITADHKDLDLLLNGFQHFDKNNTVIDERTTDTWHDMGYWLVLPLLFILLPLFRRGSVVCLLLVPFLAPESAQALEWQDLWLTKDQQAVKALQQGDLEKAQSTFNNNDWKAASAYKNGDYKTAAELYNGDNATHLYNRGNALAQSGKLKEALSSYTQALKQDPDMNDAKTGKSIVEELLKQQENQNSPDNQQGDQANDDKSQQNPSDSEQSNQDSDQSESEGDNSKQQPSDNQNEGDNDDQQADSGEQNKEQNQSNQESSSNDEEQSKDQQQANDAEAAPNNTEQPEEQASLQAQPDAGELTDEERQQMDQWLRQIPDDPGSLLRKKFQYESQKRAMDEHRGLQAPSENQQRW